MSIQKKAAEVIKKTVYTDVEHNKYEGTELQTFVIVGIDQAAAKIMELLEAEDKTLALIASEAGIPLYRAMKIADYGKKEYKKLLLSELPNKRVPDEYHSYDEIKAWNEYDREIKRRLEGK